LNRKIIGEAIVIATKIIFQAMQEFLRSSRGKSQEEILKAFLEEVIHRGHLSESGSILIDYPEDQKLRLFNPNDFLTEKGYLKRGEPWQAEFKYDDGVAGDAFRHRRSVFVPDVSKSSLFTSVEGQVPIKGIICVPIILDDRSAPFGVASFHNAVSSLIEESEYLAEAHVAVLSLALAASAQRLERRRTVQRRIFIGCASEDLSIAQKIQSQLRKYALSRIWDQGIFRSGGYVLEILLKQVKEYDCAIFLMTPNDFIEHRGKRYLVARDNVIFEAGLFFSQLGRQRTFLIVPEARELKLPSDLDGLIRLNYVPPGRADDLDMALGPVCNEIIDFIQNPLPPVT
jgi:predicted nucleotide-binding protein